MSIKVAVPTILDETEASCFYGDVQKVLQKKTDPQGIRDPYYETDNGGLTFGYFLSRNKWIFISAASGSKFLSGDASTRSWDDFYLYGVKVSGLHIYNKEGEPSMADVSDVKVCVGSSLVKVRKIIKDGVSLYQRDIPYDGLKFTANTNGSSVKIEKQSDAPNVNLFVSYDGRNWTSYTVGNIVTLEKAGDYVYFKAGPGGNSSMGSSMYSNNRFVMTGSISASGNVMSILDASLLKNDVGYYCFCSLFENCDSLTTAPSLPATTLNDGCCYMGMFDGCKNLISAPELPAMNVSQQSYLSMFRGCKNLTNVPLLPATKAGFLSYSAMFVGCSNLRGIPVIKANTLSSYCFDSMFNGCGSINGVNLPVGCGYDESIHGSFATDHTITVFYI